MQFCSKTTLIQPSSHSAALRKPNLLYSAGDIPITCLKAEANLLALSYPYWPLYSRTESSVFNQPPGRRSHLHSFYIRIDSDSVNALKKAFLQMALRYIKLSGQIRPQSFCFLGLRYIRRSSFGGSLGLGESLISSAILTVHGAQYQQEFQDLDFYEAFSVIFRSIAKF